LLLGLNAGLLGAEPLFLLHTNGLGPLASGDLGDFAFLLLHRLHALSFKFQDGLLGLDVLLLNGLFLLASEEVFLDLLVGSQLGDLLDAFGVQDVARAEQFERRLFQVVDRAVVQLIAVQIDADHFHDAGLELLPLVVQVDEVESLSDRLQGFRELGIEQLHQNLLVRRTVAADRFGHFLDVRGVLVDAHEERHADVGSDIVSADQAVGTVTANLDSLERQFHDVHAMRDGNHPHTGSGRHLQLSQTGSHQGFIRAHFAVELRQHEAKRQTQKKQSGTADGDGGDHIPHDLVSSDGFRDQVRT
jgi:hypothetical protein